MPNVVLFPELTSRIPILLDVVDGFPDTVHELHVSVGGGGRTAPVALLSLRSLQTPKSWMDE